MTNIISIGCSHSLGSYDEKDNVDKHMPWPRAVFTNCTDVGYFFHIGLPGHGVIDYCFYIEQLDKEGILKDVDKLLIQHTSEPRCVFYISENVHSKFFKTKIKKYFDNKKTTKYRTEDLRNFLQEKFDPRRGLIPLNICGTSIFSHLFNTSNMQFMEDFEILVHNFSKSNTAKQAVNLSHQRIHQLAEKNNIELHEFIWPNMSTDIEAELFSPDPGDDYDNMRNYNGHVNKEGHEIIKNSILDYLRDNDFFK